MSARADLTGQQIGEWVVSHKAPAQARKPFWAVEHTPCGRHVDVAHALLVPLTKGKAVTLPPCTACTPAEAGPAVSHGMHLACGQAHLVGTPCGKAGPGECQHGYGWQTCPACTPGSFLEGVSYAKAMGEPAPGAYVVGTWEGDARAVAARFGMDSLDLEPARRKWSELTHEERYPGVGADLCPTCEYGTTERCACALDLDAFAYDGAPRELDLDALDAEPMPPVLYLDLAAFASGPDESIAWHKAGAFDGAHEFRSFAGSSLCAETVLNLDGDTDVCREVEYGPAHRPPFVEPFNPDPLAPDDPEGESAASFGMGTPAAILRTAPEQPRALDLEQPRPEILRNGRGQPMIVPREGGKAVPYTRISSFAKTLDDAGGLTTWRVRLAGLGIAKNPDLAMMIAALEYGDRELDGILETAHDRAGGNAKANWGTAVHSFADRGSLKHVPEEMQADVEAYFDALERHGLVVDSLGRFVVNDTYRVAGTFDQIVRDRDGRRIVLDQKTGTLHPLACAIQLAVYAGGEEYIVAPSGETIVRTPLDVDQDLAIIAHIPKGTGTCELYEVDLQVARRYANMAVAVRAARKDKALARPMPLPAERVSA